MARFLVAAHGALVLALMAGVLAIWRIRCESFGCMGIGVAWFAWVVAFIVVLGVGLAARAAAGPGSRLTRAARVAWWLQMLLGAVLFAVWAARQLA